MSLKKYSDLTDKQKKLVEIMYSDHANLEMYLYNFDGEKYSGRQFSPPIGVIHVEEVKSTTKEEVKEVVKPKRTKKK